MEIFNKITTISLINIVTYIVLIKLINYKGNNCRKVFIICIFSIIEAIMASILSNYIVPLLGMIIIYSFHGSVIAKLTNNKLQYSIILTFISLVVAYIMYVIAVIIASTTLRMLIPSIKINNIGILIFGIIIVGTLLYGFFRIKRYKNGISFLQNKERVGNIGIIGFAFCGITLMIFTLSGNLKTYQQTAYLFIGLLIEAICLTIWIRRKITKHYKQNLRKNTIQELEDEIKSKDEEISKILKENSTIATINHKYSSRIKALEKISSKILTKPEIIEAMKTEFGEEFGELQEQINKISEEYTKEINEKVKHENKLEKTGVFGIDNILEYMKEEAENKGIKFETKINGSINYLIEKIISQSRLETLLGDHIKDAIIAIEHSTNTYKRILVTIGIIDNSYEIRIYDTGIEFEIETLLKLGTEAITTHKETGGSGIGFMTTFETLKETKASLIIEEKHPMNNTDYTKIVAIRFDGKNEYRIKSYRAEDIKMQRKDNRIIVE